MPEHEFRQVVVAISSELAQALSQVEEGEAGRLEEALLAAGAVFVTGEGRSGLMARGFAMRLMQLGLRAYVVGETTTPAAQPGDLLVAVSGSGQTRSTCVCAETARALGIQVAAVTATPESRLAGLADLRVLVPKESAQHGGSLFEQTALVFFDAVASLLQRRLGKDSRDLEARHANLE
jgi:6-phospho-3-hexuloisomerase